MLVGEVLAKLGVDLTEYRAGMRQAERQAQSTAGTIGSLFKNAFSVALGIGFFEAVQQGFRAVVGEAVSFNSMMEQARIGFTTMLGSAERAEAFLSDMAEFAARTPFEFPELLDASKRMLAYGFAAEDVLPTMEAVGNASAAVGLGTEGINRIIRALGQMRAKGKLSAEEMRQLTETGIPAWEILAEAMNKTTAEIMDMQSKGLIPADRAIKMLVEGMNKRFPNMMKNMENTWEGVTSTIKDVWRLTLGAVTSNLFKAVTQWLQKVRDFATDFYNTFRQFGLRAALVQHFGAEFAVAINIASAALRGLWNTAKTVLGAIIKYWAILKPLVLTTVTAFLTFKVVTGVLTQLTFVMAVMRGEAVATSGILNFVARAVQIYRVQLSLASAAGIAHVGVLQTLRTVLYSVWSAMGPLGWAILGVSAAVTGGIMLWSKYAASVEKANLQKTLQAISGQEAKVSDTSKQAAQGLQDQADATKKAGKAANDNLQPFDELNKLSKETAQASEDIASGLEQVATPELPAVGGVGAPPAMDVGKMLEAQKPTLSGFFNWIKEGMVSAWDAIKAKWSEASPLFKAIAIAIATILIPALVALGVAAVRNVAIMVAQLVIAAGRWVWMAGVALANAARIAAAWVISLGPVGWVTAAVIALAALIVIYWDEIKEYTAKAWEATARFVSESWDNIKDATIRTWNNVKNYLTNTWDSLKNTATSVWNSVATFFSMIWGTIKTNVSQAWDSIKSTLTTVWGTLSTTASTVWNGIKNTVMNVTGIMASGLTQSWNTIRNTASSVWGNISSTISGLMQSLRGSLSNIWSNISSTLTSTWSNLKSSASNIFSSIADAITKPFRNIHIPLPHFSFTTTSTTVAGVKISIPKVSVDWYAQGGIFTQPSIIGVGEAGPEAVLPLSDTSWMDRLAERIAAALRTAQPAMAGAGGDIYVYIGNEQVDAYIYRSQERRNIKSNGR